MSIAVMTWVFEQDIRPSQIKFVLLALADNCGQSGIEAEVWPSIETICKKTSQDRKTVMAALDRLETMGLLRDTGARVGRTGQVKVYEIVGVPSSRSHYVYRLVHKETGDYYIGVRSCNGDPAADPYMGSGKWPLSVGPEFLKKEILHKFETRCEAGAEEARLIRRCAADKKCQNRCALTKFPIVPNTEPLKSPAHDAKESRAGLGTVPSTALGTVREPESNQGLQDSLELVGSSDPENSLQEAWNEIETLPKIVVFSPTRKAAFRSRMKDPVFRENWQIALVKLGASDFAGGKNARGWTATVDWFLKPDTVAKILEGRYDNREGSSGKRSAFA